MNKLRYIVAVILFFAFINTAFSQNSIDNIAADSLVKEKIAFIETCFINMQTNAKTWKYGWYAGFTALAVGQGSLALISDNKPLQQGMALGVVTASLGIGGLVTNPLVSIKALKTLNRMPETTLEERKIKLESAENLLKKSAEREINGKNWKSHALAGAVNISAGLVTWLGFKKSIWDGLTTFALSTAVAELQILTQPRKSITAYKNYNTKYMSSNTQSSYQKQQKTNWFVGVSPVGLRLTISF